MPVLVGLVAAIVSFAGSWIPSYWSDEVATVRAVSLSPTELWPFLGVKDAVHGAYYLALHLWTAVAGTGELATRLPSALAIGVAAGGLVVVGRQLSDAATTRHLGALAGLVLAVLPRTTYAGGEARSYALTMALAVVLTAVLLWGCRRGGTLPWLVYGVLAAAAMLVFVYLAMLVAAHLLALLVLRPGRWRIAVAAVAAAVAVGALVPFLLVVIGERGQIDWLAEGSPVNGWTVGVEPWFDENAWVAGACIAVLAAGVIVTVRRHGRIRLARDAARSPLVVHALAWAIVPFVLLLAAQAALGPLYLPRYLTFTTPALALLIAASLLSLPWRRAAVVGLAALVVIAAPGWIAQRGPYAKNGGSDLRQLADTVAAHARPGDAIAFEEDDAQHPREALYAYPDRFAGLHDIAVVQRFPTTGTFSDRTVDAQQLPLEGVDRLWWAASSRVDDCAALPDAAIFARDGLHVAATYPVHRTTVCLFER